MGLTPEELGDAAGELEDLGLAELLKTFGCGPAGFSEISPTASLFLATDQALQSWEPSTDAVALAAVLINCGDDFAELAEADRILGWGPRRLNPAAAYLSRNGIVRPLQEMGSAPYAFSAAAVSHRTRRFAGSI